MSNLEDRRNEHDAMTQLLISIGILPPHPDQGMRDLYNLKDGEWLDPVGSDYRPLTPRDTLSIEAGANDLDNQIRNTPRVQRTRIGR